MLQKLEMYGYDTSDLGRVRSGLTLDYWWMDGYWFDFLQSQFVVDEVSAVIKEAIESVIGGNTYQHSKVNAWSSSIMDTCLQSLVKLAKPFKYIGTPLFRINLYH